MTKQQKIREGIARWLYDWEYGHIVDRRGVLPYTFGDWVAGADSFLEYLHSQGVVLKVARELPHTYKQQFVDYPEDDEGELDMARPKFEVSVMTIPEGIRRSIKDAGYTAFEPLIEEVKDG